MLAVLYSADLRPLSVLEVSPENWRKLRDGEIINFAAPGHARLPVNPEPEANECYKKMPVVSVRGWAIRFGKHETLILVTYDADNATRLPQYFLPGQTDYLRERWGI